MDIVGGVRLADGSEAKVVTGIDDYSRFCVSALVVARATARPVCDALALAMRSHGVPDQILTDNGKVFTGRFGRAPGRCCSIGSAGRTASGTCLTAPRSPTTTGKVERFHKTMRREFLDRQGLRHHRRRPGRSSMVGCSTTTRAAASGLRAWRPRGTVPAAGPSRSKWRDGRRGSSPDVGATPGGADPAGRSPTG